eukprot:TRINITY_DN45604_c0_g1_i1.p1 TRINITY_DN45604_c0_g1~~TRINITY_DN45604_c0_g1_i1.p1  ORF type:complete len:105 (-),score=19.83 TRINITY_DN45604_c0_g1_i1:187-501(-)
MCIRDRERSDDDVGGNTTAQKGGGTSAATEENEVPDVVAATDDIGNEEVDGGVRDLPQGRPTQRPVLVRICLGGTAQHLLPLEMVRREHPQLLINYLLSVTQVR